MVRRRIALLIFAAMAQTVWELWVTVAFYRFKVIVNPAYTFAFDFQRLVYEVVKLRHLLTWQHPFHFNDDRSVHDGLVGRADHTDYHRRPTRERPNIMIIPLATNHIASLCVPTIDDPTQFLPVLEEVGIG